MKPSAYQNLSLTTPYTARTEDWHHAYPRPALRRSEGTYHILSDWTLTCVSETTQTQTQLGKIRLPFPPEAPLSGIGMTLDSDEAWLYETTVNIAKEDLVGHILLHLPPTDQMCIVTLPRDYSIASTV